MTQPTAPHREFSRPVAVERLPEGGSDHRIAADAAERAALARRFGLLALDRFVADVHLRRIGGGAIRLESAIAADLVQQCVVTLDPVPQHLTDRCVIVFRRAEPSREAVIEAGEEEFETLTGSEIDLGETVAQQLSLALDPFPRAPGADAAAAADAEGAKRAATHPFAALARLAKK